MSATAQPVEKMSGDEAYNVLIAEGFAPVFFQKLAANGIDPQTEEERMAYLRMGHKLLQADQHEQVKRASTRVSFLGQAEADLDAEMNRRYGTPTQPQVTQAQEQYVKQASEVLGSHPLFQQAVEDYNAAVEAEQARLQAAGA